MKHSLVPRVGVGALSSPLEVGADRAPAVSEQLAARLRDRGCEVVEFGVIDTPDAAVKAGRLFAEKHVEAMVVAPVCWCEDYLVLDLLEECARPLMLWPQPGMETGALCGTQQVTCHLKQLGRPYGTAFGDLADDSCLDRAMAYVRAASLKSGLRRARIGLAGHHVNGMTHTAPNEFVLKKAIGPRVVFLDLPLLLQRWEQMSEDDARLRWERMKAEAGSTKVRDDVGLESMKMYAAVKELIDEHGLAALSVGCYPHLMGSVCLAASLLADEGVPLACEGDVHGAVAQLMLQRLTGGPTHNTDWLDPMEDGTVVFTHCGSGSFGLAGDSSKITLDSVRLMGRGVCALFPARPGPVTLLGITPAGDRYQCAMLEGEALESEMVFPGNPLRVQFNKPVEDVIAWIHEEGIGHHWMVGYGRAGQEIRDWAAIAGDAVRLVEL